ncbi:MAG: glycosyltransferase family 39 protein [Planctomycetales bacterium]|nr:glycosyltransferase family 39 protein [Planctomycetales bacterium]
MPQADNNASQKRFCGALNKPLRVTISNLPASLRRWWNCDQFHANAEPKVTERIPEPRSRGAERRLVGLQLALLVVASLLLLPGRNYPLIDRDETRYAEIPREMLVTSDWLVPRLNFKTYYDKPPLLYWACAASYAVFGVSEQSARLTPALAGLLTLALTMWFANRQFDRRVGLFAGLSLAPTVGFLASSRILLIDCLLTLLVALSLFAAHEAVRERRFKRTWWLLAGAASGVAFLAKGPIALVLFIPPVVAFTWLTERASRPGIRHWLMYGGVVGAIALPWFAAVNHQVPDFAYQFFYRHNVERFGGAFHAKPCWFFLPVLLAGGHPWSFLALPCVNYLLSANPAVRLRRTPPLGFAVLWAVWCLAFFSVSRCKLPPYILPAAPALAVVFGKYLADLFEHQAGLGWNNYALRWAPWLATITTLGAALGLTAFGASTGFELSAMVGVVAAIAVALLGVAFVLRDRLERPETRWGFCVATTLLAGAFVLHREIPQYALAQSVFAPQSQCREEFACMSDVPMVTIGHEWSGAPFYLHRSDIANVDTLSPENLPLDRNASNQLLMVARLNKSCSDAVPALPAGAHVVAAADRGRARILLVEFAADAGRVASPPHRSPTLR